MKKNGKLFLIFLFLLLFVGCSHSNNVNLKNTDKIFIEDEEIQPKKIRIDDDSVQIEMEWSFGYDKNSRQKRSILNKKMSVYAYQNGDLLLPNTNLSTSMSKKFYEKSKNIVSFGFYLKNMYTPIGVKIVPSNSSPDTYPFNFFIDICDKKYIDNKDSELLANQIYVRNIINNIFNVLNEISLENRSDANFYLDQIENDNNFLKQQKLELNLDMYFRNILEAFSNSVEKILILLNKLNDGSFKNIDAINSDMTELINDIANYQNELNENYFYNDQSYKDINKCFSKSKNKGPEINESDLEEALKNHEDVLNQIVYIEVQEPAIKNSYGHDIFAGDHLNFVSYKNPHVKKGDKIKVRILSVEDINHSYIIRYKLLEKK